MGISLFINEGENSVEYLLIYWALGLLTAIGVYYSFKNDPSPQAEMVVRSPFLMLTLLLFISITWPLAFLECEGEA